MTEARPPSQRRNPRAGLPSSTLRSRACRLLLFFACLSSIAVPSLAQPESRVGELVAQGLKAVAAGDYSTAISAFTEATQIDPQDPSAWLALAEAQRAMGQGEGALDAAMEARRLAPRQPEVLITLAEIMAMRGDFDEALALATEAEQIVPGSANVLILKSALLSELGQADTAISLLRAAWSKTPRDPRVGEQLAVVLWDEGRGVEAAQIADRAYSADPSRANAALVIGMQMATQGTEPLTAAYWLETAQRAGVPGGERLSQDIGRLRLEGGDLEGAVRALEFARSLSPGSPQVLGLLADAYEAAGDVQRAADARAAAAELGSPLEMELAEIRRMVDRGRFVEALDRIEPLLDRNPNDVRLMTLQASIFASRGRFKEAIDAIGSARALQPEEPELQYLEGLFLLLDGRVDEAHEAAQAALTLDDGMADAHNLLAGILAKRGDFEGAVVHFERALDLGLDSRELRLGYAAALESLGSRAGGRSPDAGLPQSQGAPVAGAPMIPA